MKAVQVMFDTLSRRFLSIYGNDWVQTPNFERLARKATVHNRFFAGSLPCIPARRELHTGRYNFLHRSWGPLEPFDFSVIETLKKKGVYTHLITDHSHYFEDGGATYHNRFNTWEAYRGQEGDRWVPTLDPSIIDIPTQASTNKKGESLKHNYANRTRQTSEFEMSSVRTVLAGCEFIDQFNQNDSWFLQIECFDPHEPFFVPQKYLDLYEDHYVGDVFDWPPYSPITTETPEQQEHVIKRYAALITMCDTYLGKVLDKFDEYDLWKDTLLIVNTDHGFLMGEHEWYGKNIQPMYNEVAHLPFVIYDPRTENDSFSNDLSRSIDIAPTLLDFFNLDIPKVVQGKVINKEHKVEDALFGMFGMQVNITDGHYVYMRGPIRPKNEPLFEYTLMPTRMRGFVEIRNLQKTTLQEAFNFTSGLPLLKIPTGSFMNPYRYGHKLFNIDEDYEQIKPLDDLKLELHFLNKLKDAMKENDAPLEQYQRLGLNISEDMTLEQLLAQRALRKEDMKVDIGIELTSKQEAQIRLIREMMPEKLYVQFELDLKLAFSRTSDPDIVIQSSIKQFTEMMRLPEKALPMILNMFETADKDD